MRKQLEEGDIVLCTVDRILGTTVFVKIDDYGSEGVVPTPEVAPGRIRNIRDYVVPNKKIVCRVLRIDRNRGHIDLSLRRVSLKERSETLERHKKEKDAAAMLKIILKENAQQVIDKIKADEDSMAEFMQHTNLEKLKKYLSDKDAELLLNMLKERPERNVSISTSLSMSSDASDGLLRIRGIFEKLIKDKKVNVKYLAASRYLVTAISSNYKDANKILEQFKSELLKDAKQQGIKAEFEE